MFESPVSIEKTSMPTSWRAFSESAFWDDYDVVISSEGGASGRKQFEVFVRGHHLANRPKLMEAKELVESKYEILGWKVVRLTPMEVDHYWFGLTTEFTSPTTIWVAKFG